MATAGASGGTGPERAWASPLPATGLVRLDLEESRHLLGARRARAGDDVVLFDGAGTTRRARLVEAKPSGALLEVLGDSPDREPDRAVAVGVALPGAGRADDLVATLAELGVSLLIPLVAARAAVPAADLATRRAERWARLAREACKVNGRSRALRVAAPLEVEAVPAWAAAGGGFVPVVLHTDPALPRLPEVLRTIASPILLVGPEGGFTDGERAALAAAGVPGGSLGACVLRTETAAAAAAAVALAR